jgi:mannosyltransferase OCH1-like enzyme
LHSATPRPSAAQWQQKKKAEISEGSAAYKMPQATQTALLNTIHQTYISAICIP